MIGWAEAFAKAREVDTSKMTLTQWLNMWGRLCYRSAGISDFPIWVQLLPSVFFDVMDESCKFTSGFFFQHFYGSGCSWSLPVRWVLEPKSLSFFSKCLSFFPRALEFFPKHWNFEDLESDIWKNGCVLQEICSKSTKHSIFSARFAQICPVLARL